MNQYPIFISTRDRLNGPVKLINWLEAAGQEEIYIVDNQSTYPPLVEYLAQSPHTVIDAGANMGNIAPWASGAVDMYSVNRYYVTSDDDIIPTEDCPYDLFDLLHWGLTTYDRMPKASPSLIVDDLPEHYVHRNVAFTLHGRWQTPSRAIDDKFYDCSSIDGVMALNRPGIAKQFVGARAQSPYSARHLSWYTDLDNPDEETKFYLDHASRSLTSWIWDEVNDYCKEEMRTYPRSRHLPYGHSFERH